MAQRNLLQDEEKRANHAQELQELRQQLEQQRLDVEELTKYKVVELVVVVI